MSAVPGLILGIGWRALAGKAAGNAIGDVRAVGHWLGSLDLVHLCLLVALLFGGWQTVGRWSQHRHTAKVEAQLLVTNNALTMTRANEAALKKAIADQNAAIASIGTKSAQQQSMAAKASQAAQGRANEAEATAARLRAGTRPAGLKSAPAAPCEPSDTLKGQWK